MSYHKSECRNLEQLKLIHKASQSGITFEDWLGLRDRCRKDLFFLCKSVLNWTRVIERVHQPVCDFFPKLNFDGVYHDGYTLEEVQNAIQKQSEDREFLLLDPRGAFKSTIDSGFVTQFLLNAPDARIFIVTGEYDNAVDFLTQIKKYFYKPEGAKPSKLQQLFPEYILGKQDGESASPLECPARIHTEQKESSLWVNAITATLASKHCDLMVGDDVVSDRNSTTPEARFRLKDKYDNSENLLDEWGYKINIGTRYAPDDWYGSRLKIKDEAPLKYFCRAAWTVLPGFEDVPIKELKKHMVELLFPEKLSWAVLRKKVLNNERDFRCQQLNEPQGDEQAIHFEEDVLRAHLEADAPPPEGDSLVVIAWDWAPTANDKSDYSSGVVARVDKSTAEVHVLEVVYGRFNFEELAFQMVKLAKQWNPCIVLVERAVGTELLENEIRRQSARLQYSCPLVFHNFGHENNAKANRVKGLLTLLTNDRLWFVGGPWIDETFSQFTRYTGLKKNKGRKDDIPDSVSMLQFFLPAEAMNPVEPLTWEKQEEMRKTRELEAHQDAFRTYVGGMFTPVPKPVMAAPKPQRRRAFDLRHLALKF